MKNARPISLTGCFSPFQPSGMVGVPDQPCLLNMHDSPGQFFVPVFSDLDDMKAAMALWGIREYKIKEIQDGLEFAESILAHKEFRIMLNPKIISKDKTRWTEVIL